MNTLAESSTHPKVSPWREWLERPEKTRIHRLLFEFHLWAGMLVGTYVLVMSATGSLIVFRSQLENNPQSRLVPVVEWIVNLHENLLAGTAGRAVVGAGGACLALVGISGMILWWPGIEHWRRSLTIDWKASAARLNWDLHNTLGFWFSVFV